MRSRLIAAAGGLLLVLGAACAPSYDIRTVASPDASIADLHAFRVLPVPPRRDGREPVGAYDPMVNNSITNRALRDAISRQLVARGYVVDESHPDFAVAVYASATEGLDVTAWDYGYPYWPHPRGLWPAEHATTYTAGTVIVDVVSPTSRELWWRGTGTARLSEDPARDVKALQVVAAEIVKRFPRAVWRGLAAR